jgi:hypothetical protein
MNQSFWSIDPDLPFGTLITVAETYCHPEAYDEAYDDLKILVKREGDEEIKTFKDELRQAILTPEKLPDDELYSAVQYDDGSAADFLRRLWRDLYPDEPVPGQA